MFAKTLLLLTLTGPAAAASDYFPPRGSWEHRPPEAVGMDAAALDAAVTFALEHPLQAPHDLKVYLLERNTDTEDPILGPTKARGDINGLVVKDGYIVAEFGDTKRVDMTFSVTKSFLSTMAALALDEGLLDELNKPVTQTLDLAEFDGPRHGQITWDHLLTQTSEWEGTLWERPDTADRRKGVDRELQSPGTFWEYNDVRVNLAAYALLELWQRPLPAVLKKRVMDPIGASDAWYWHGYRTSWTEIDGRPVQSVSGGGHWGGGMWISARDMARFGLLFLNDGRWQDRQIFSPSWVEQIRVPTGPEPRYGYMWWLNTDGKMWPGLPEDSYAALGSGGNVIWIDPEDNLIVVVRWIDRDHVTEFLKRVRASVR